MTLKDTDYGTDPDGVQWRLNAWRPFPSEGAGPGSYFVEEFFDPRAKYRFFQDNKILPCAEEEKISRGAAQRMRAKMRLHCAGKYSCYKKDALRNQ